MSFMLEWSLWVAGLLACVSLVALAAALGGRSRSRWKVVLLAIAAAAAPLLLSTGAVIAVAWLRTIGSEPPWLAYTLGWQVAFAFAAAAILLLAVRRDADGSLASASWRRLPLLGGCLLGVIGFFLSLGRLDASKRANMDAEYHATRETLASFARPPVPEAENAAPYYVHAFELLDDLGIIGDFAGSVFEPGFDPGGAEARANLENGTEALQAIQKALAFPHMREATDPTDLASWSGEGHALHFRDAAVLLAVDARARASAGDLDGAFSSAAALWRLTEHALEASQKLGEFLTAFEIAEGASRILESLLAVLGHRGLPTSANGPPSDLAFHARTAREIERWRAQLVGFLLQILGETKGRLEGEVPGIDRLVDPGSFPLGNILATQYLALYRCFVLPGDLASLESRLATLITLAGRPYPRASQGVLELEETVKRHRGGLFTGMFLPPLIRIVPRSARVDARLVLARAGLAAATYHVRRGTYPTRIDDLVPDFLAAIPMDPFDGRWLKLAALDGGLILYSVGEDGIDDGGKEIEDRSGRKGDITFALGAAYATKAARKDVTEE